MGDFNTGLTPMDTSSRQKISKETQALNDTLDQLHWNDTYRAFHSKKKISAFSHVFQDRSYLESQIKLWSISENWNDIKHLFQAQGYELRNQLQEKKKKNWKKHKYTEAKQYVTK